MAHAHPICCQESWQQRDPPVRTTCVEGRGPQPAAAVVEQQRWWPLGLGEAGTPSSRGCGSATHLVDPGGVVTDFFSTLKHLTGSLTSLAVMSSKLKRIPGTSSPSSFTTMVYSSIRGNHSNFRKIIIVHHHFTMNFLFYLVWGYYTHLWHIPRASAPWDHHHAHLTAAKPSMDDSGDCMRLPHQFRKTMAHHVWKPKLENLVAT